MIRTSKSFSSKLLVLGEYALLGEGLALALPYPRFNGELKIVDNLDSNVDI